MLQRIRAIQMSLCATAQRSVPVCHLQLLLFAPHLTCSKRSTSQVCTLNYWALCSSFTDCLFFSLHLPSWIKMPHSSRMDPSHNPLQQQQQQQQHQPLHGNSNMGGPGGPMHSRNSSQNPRMHTDSFGLGGPGGPGDVSEPALDVSQNQSSIPDQSNDFWP